MPPSMTATMTAAEIAEWEQRQRAYIPQPIERRPVPYPRKPKRTKHDKIVDALMRMKAPTK